MKYLETGSLVQIIVVNTRHKDMLGCVDNDQMFWFWNLKLFGLERIWFWNKVRSGQVWLCQVRPNLIPKSDTV